ncbi:MAG: hypothetical protein CMC04_00495 [Flavobacteriaceae bacterium]|nr:hypothetical protein [Flavobacteriaceae bacterium]MBQ22124.1 hypothetical protein [Flavobacteriales bacterium]
MKIRSDDLKKLIFLSNGIIIFFYSFYFFNFEPTIIGVFRELLILPALLLQFFLALVVVVNLLIKKMKLSIYSLIHIILTILLIISFQS